MKTSIHRNTILSAGFTSGTGALFHREINALLPILQSDNPSHLLKQEALENNVLLVNAERSRRKIINHVSTRIKYSFPGFWDIYLSSKHEEQALMLFYLALNSVAVIYEFHFDVTLPEWKGSSRTFDRLNYQMKLDQLGNESEVADKWTPGTRHQIIKIYKRMLKEAGFLHGDNLVQPRMTDDFYFPFIKYQQPWFLEACFLNQVESTRIINLYHQQA